MDIRPARPAFSTRIFTLDELSKGERNTLQNMHNDATHNIYCTKPLRDRGVAGGKAGARAYEGVALGPKSGNGSSGIVLRSHHVVVSATFAWPAGGRGAARAINRARS
jgi:hypothetical protein